MYLHDAMVEVLRTRPGRRAHRADIAEAVNRRRLFVRGDGNPVPPDQVSARASKHRTRSACLGTGSLASGDMRPDELAKELGVSGKTLRGWLRRRFPRAAAQKGKWWTLTGGQEAAARRQFAVLWTRAASKDRMRVTTVALPEATLIVN